MSPLKLGYFNNYFEKINRNSNQNILSQFFHLKGLLRLDLLLQSRTLLFLNYLIIIFLLCLILSYASAGNRTRGTCLEGKYVATTPRMLKNYYLVLIKVRRLRDSNPCVHSTMDQQSISLTTRTKRLNYTAKINKNRSRRDSNSGCQIQSLAC